MKHWGNPISDKVKFPQGICKTIFPQEQKELDRQAKLLKHERLPKMPIVKKPNGTSTTI